MAATVVTWRDVDTGETYSKEFTDVHPRTVASTIGDILLYVNLELVSIEGDAGWRECGHRGAHGVWVSLGTSVDKVLGMSVQVCPVTKEAGCADRNCELHYMDAPLKLAD